jgi:3',5'-nucleoside bisphosphate phosphatase
MKIDLHTHTHYSDGEFSPKQVVEKAIKENIEYLAITDHNNLSGVKEALETANNKIKIIPSAEITAQLENNKLVHIVGLYINPESKELNNLLDKVKKEMVVRIKERLKQINKKLKSEISFDKLSSKTKGFPNTAHMALTLVENNLFETFKQAIDFIIKEVSEMDLNFPSTKEVIETIHKAGGLAVLAHLTEYENYNDSERENLVKNLKSQNLDGLEVYIPPATKQKIDFANNLAEKYNLLVSCGSDFHGNSIHPKNKLGFLDIEKAKITVLRA